MTDLTERILKRAGSTIHYWVTGPEGRPLVTLTHGATMDHRMFDAQLDVLAADYRVLVWDVRGHGVSQPIGDDFSMASAADDLLALVLLEGYEQAVFAGQSMGGYIAQNLILRYPERALAFVSIGSTSITLPFSLLDRVGLALTPPTLRLTPYDYLKRLTARTVAVTADAQRYAYDAMSQIDKGAVVAIMSAVARAPLPTPGYVLPVPALLTHGDRDTTGKIKAYAPRWAESQPHAEYVVVPDAGHNANQDNPAFFNRVLMDFLHRHVPAGSDAGAPA